MSTALRKRVLIIDDDKDICECIGKALSDKYDTLKAYDGVIGLAVALKQPPDLFLLDITMPKMSGYQVMDNLKKNPQLKNIPVIFISAKSSTQERDFGMKKGAVGYIGKPFNLEYLIETVEKVLNPPVSPLTEQPT